MFDIRMTVLWSLETSVPTFATNCTNQLYFVVNGYSCHQYIFISIYLCKRPKYYKLLIYLHYKSYHAHVILVDDSKTVH